MEPIQNYRLRKLEETDLEMVLAWRNSEHVRVNMFTDRIIFWEEHRNWFENLRKSTSAQSMIFEFQERPFGVVNISQINQQNQTCFWGFFIGESERPKGMGTVMGFLAIDYIFHSLHMRKLCAEVLAFNKISLNYHKKLGFQQEGHFVEHVWKNGAYEDVVFLSLFKQRWDVIRDQLRLSISGGAGNHE